MPSITENINTYIQNLQNMATQNPVLAPAMQRVIGNIQNVWGIGNQGDDMRLPSEAPTQQSVLPERMIGYTGPVGSDTGPSGAQAGEAPVDPVTGTTPTGVPGQGGVSGELPPEIDAATLFNPDGSPNVQAIMEAVSGLQTWANRENLARYQDILGLYGGMGEAGRQRISEAQRQQVATGTQDLISRGLFNTTMGVNLQRAAASDAERARQSLEESVAGAQAGVMERRETTPPAMDLLSSLLGQATASTAGEPTGPGGAAAPIGRQTVTVPNVGTQIGGMEWLEGGGGGGGFGDIGSGPAMGIGGGGGGGSVTLRGTQPYGQGLMEGVPTRSAADLRRELSQRGIPTGSARTVDQLQRILDTVGGGAVATPGGGIISGAMDLSGITNDWAGGIPGTEYGGGVGTTQAQQPGFTLQGWDPQMTAVNR
jgi:hypothetical protein